MFHIIAMGSEEELLQCAVYKTLALSSKGCVLQCVAVCCSVLQCVAVCQCAVNKPDAILSKGCMLQCVAVCCSELRCVNVLFTKKLPSRGRGLCIFVL